MSGSISPAARLRGGFVGALAASTTLAAHGVAGGVVPCGGAIVVLVLASGALAAAAGAAVRPGFLATVAMLTVGQALGHLLMVTAGHDHGSGHVISMLAAHGLAAAAGAALVVVAERLCRSVMTARGWLSLLVLGLRLHGESRPGARLLTASRTLRPLYVPAEVTDRGPPVHAHA